MVATTFTPLSSLIGGTLIGTAAVVLMAVKGRIAGVSGIASRLFPPYADREFVGRLVFVLGLIVSPLIYTMVAGHGPVQAIEANTYVLTLAGFLVGFGSVWGNGCTSGHGVCGLSRLSVRSMIATVVFMTTAIITVFIIRHVL